MLDLLPSLRSALALFLVANTLLVCHELGHLLAGRCFGVRARRFVVGFGPSLLRTTDRHGTEWTLGLLPLGGFVGFETTASNGSTDYEQLAPPARMAIFAAGPAANLLLAIVTFAIMLGIAGEPTFLPVASSIVPGSAAERAGFEVGDRIVSIAGRPVATFEDMRPVLRAGAGQTIQLAVLRGEQHLDLYAGLGSAEEGGRTIGVLGIRSHSVERHALGPVDAVVKAARKTWETAADTFGGVWRAMTRDKDADRIAGVIGVANIAGAAAQDGPMTLLALTAILSVNIGLMNLLPVPVLDGGAIILCAIEMVRGRRLSLKAQHLATGVSIALMATLFAMATLHDLDGIGLFRWLGRL